MKSFKDTYDRLLLTKRFSNPEPAVQLLCNHYHTPHHEREVLFHYLRDHWNRKDHEAKFYPEVETVLGQLKRRGYKLALVSNAECFLENSVVRKLPLKKYFSVLSLSYEQHSVKPDPKLFLHALESLRVSPSEAVMVGDTKRTDILGAKRLGIRTVWVDQGKVQHGKAKPHHRIRTLKALLSLLP